jgi:hypothetical protein
MATITSARPAPNNPMVSGALAILMSIPGTAKDQKIKLDRPNEIANPRVVVSTERVSIDLLDEAIATIFLIDSLPNLALFYLQHSASFEVC